MTVTVQYPRDETSTFDLDYYLSTHIPMVAKAWGPYGLISWAVIEVPKPPSGPLPPYSIQAFVTFEAKGETGFEGAVAGLTSEEGKALSADVVNFSNRTPEVLIGSVKGSG